MFKEHSEGNRRSTWQARLGAKTQRGQSFVELALAIPLILIMFVGMIEVGFLVFNYLNALDLTREAARFASVRDYRIATTGAMAPPFSECTDQNLDYYKDTACFFVDNTLNPNLPLDPNKFDDVTISVFTIISGTQATISDRWPQGSLDPDGDGVWSLYNNNWQRDCQGNVIHTEPTFTDAEVEALMLSSAPKAKGLVLVEAFICYDQMLFVPQIAQYIGSPFRIHTYTFMPAPEAIPTPTPIP
jgi:hypothetical protein